jgi:dTMP kinase
MAFIEAYLRNTGKDVVVTREPGGTVIAERIRELILHSKPDEMSDLAELMLMFAARADHLAQVIKPALAAGRTVLCDRFTDATFAYQGGGRNLDETKIAALRDLVQGDLRPDLTLLLDAPLETSAARMAGRAMQDRFEQEELAFFGRVQARYRAIAAAEPGRVKLINADQPLEDVQNEIREILDISLK